MVRPRGTLANNLGHMDYPKICPHNCPLDGWPKTGVTTARAEVMAARADKEEKTDFTYCFGPLERRGRTARHTPGGSNTSSQHYVGLLFECSSKVDEYNFHVLYTPNHRAGTVNVFAICPIAGNRDDSIWAKFGLPMILLIADNLSQDEVPNLKLSWADLLVAEILSSEILDLLTQAELFSSQT
ncbi:hypothetical protein CsSME_00026291 [Camellia sinensis var. sinensis]